MSILYKDRKLNYKLDYSTGKLIENIILNHKITFLDDGRPIIHNLDLKSKVEFRKIDY